MIVVVNISVYTFMCLRTVYISKKNLKQIQKVGFLNQLLLLYCHF